MCCRCLDHVDTGPRQRTTTSDNEMKSDEATREIGGKDEKNISNGHKTNELSVEKLSAAGDNDIEVPRNITLIGGISFIVGTIIGNKPTCKVVDVKLDHELCYHKLRYNELCYYELCYHMLYYQELCYHELCYHELCYDKLCYDELFYHKLCYHELLSQAMLS